MNYWVDLFVKAFLLYTSFFGLAVLTSTVATVRKEKSMDMGVMQVWAPCFWIKIVLKPVLVLVLLVQSVLAYLCVLILCPFFRFHVSYGQIQAKVDDLGDRLPTKYIADFVCILHDFFDSKEQELYVMAMEAG